MISVEELIEALSEAAYDGNVIIRYHGIAFYAKSTQIENGDVIISADEVARGEE
jgi:hypothetical protein